jgi:hypothetical protein
MVLLFSVLSRPFVPFHAVQNSRRATMTGMDICLLQLLQLLAPDLTIRPFPRHKEFEEDCHDRQWTFVSCNSCNS